MQHINTPNSTNHQWHTPRRLSLALTVALSAIALTACGGGGKGNSQSSNQGGSHIINPNNVKVVNQSGKGSKGGNTQNTSSPISATYYEIEQDISPPDVSKRYADVKKITIKNGKVTKEKISREMGTGSATSWSNSNNSNNIILAEKFSVKDKSSSDSLMDTKAKKRIWYPDRINTVITDNTNNNTINSNLKIKQVDLSGKKVYDPKSKINTRLNRENGSVSEVYPQGASCLGFSIESLQPADKVYIQLDPTKSNETYTSFTEWQDKHKKFIKLQKEALQMIGDAENIKVGSNNEYDAQIIKVKMNDPNDKVQMTFYYSAIKYQGKIYDTSGDFLPPVYPNTKIIVDPSSPTYDTADCMYYNKVAKDYIIAQLKTLP